MGEPSTGSVELTPDELQLAFHEVECHAYDERFGISYGPDLAARALREVERLVGDGARFARVLDVGCGTGYLGLGLLAGGAAGEAWLVDLSPGMLQRAAENAQRLGLAPRLVRASAAALPFPEDHFDAVVSRGVLHHLHDPVAALAEWRRVVRRDGPVILTSEPSPHADGVGGHLARATLAGLRGARAVARRLGRPLPQLAPDAAQRQRFWDLVAMAANIHTFTPSQLRALGHDAGFADIDVRGSGGLSIGWATAYYVLVGEHPRLGRSPRSRDRAARLYAALRRLDALLVEPLVPDRLLLTVQAVMRA